MNIFDILGPVMVGPSSSHTAGAVRIGYITRTLLGEEPESAEIRLHGSFADTGAGHGTNRALVAGLLGMKPDDGRIPSSFEEAQKEGMAFSIVKVHLPGAHPNTACILAKGMSGKRLEVQASSLGGGRIMLNKLDGIEVNCTGECPTLIVKNQDQPGCVAEVSSVLAKKEVNIAVMHLYRDKRGGRAVTVIEMDQKVSPDVVTALENLEGITKVTYVEGE